MITLESICSLTRLIVDDPSGGMLHSAFTNASYKKVDLYNALKNFALKFYIYDIA